MTGITIKDEGDWCTLFINEDDAASVLDLIESLGFATIKLEPEGYRSSTRYNVLAEASALFEALCLTINYKDIEIA